MFCGSHLISHWLLSLVVVVLLLLLLISFKGFLLVAQAGPMVPNVPPREASDRLIIFQVCPVFQLES